MQDSGSQGSMAGTGVADGMGSAGGVGSGLGLGLAAGAGGGIGTAGGRPEAALTAQRPQMLQLALDLAQQRARVDPASTDLIFEQGYLLEQLGRPLEARGFYGRVLD